MDVGQPILAAAAFQAAQCWGREVSALQPVVERGAASKGGCTVENLFLIRSLRLPDSPKRQRGDGFARTRPRADAWGYLDRQWIGFHHDSLATGHWLPHV